MHLVFWKLPEVFTLLFHFSDNKLCDSAWVKKLDPTMAGLGARTPHLAPLLAWAVLQLRASDGGAKGNPRMYNKLAQRAVHGNVFAYLQTALNNTSIQVCGKA